VAIGLLDRMDESLLAIKKGIVQWMIGDPGAERGATSRRRRECSVAAAAECIIQHDPGGHDDKKRDDEGHLSNVLGAFDHPRSRRVVIHTSPETNRPVTIVPIARDSTVRRIRAEINLLIAKARDDKALEKIAATRCLQLEVKAITMRTLYTI
jgi:hypothetical protein